MNDITELAQRMKAAAEKATPGEWVYFPKNTSIEYDVGSDESQGSILYVDSGDFTQVQTDRNGEFIALANPANILALVEALEKVQRYIEELREWNAGLAQESFERQQLISELVPIRAAAEKLVRCKGRYHSEQNYRALAALFGVNTPDLPPLDDESRAVNVENLQESAYRAGLTAGWNLGLANNNDGFNKCLAAHTAGIKVEAE
ncbi:TPA: ead/Ea22-like family protein [Klebsiella pneumoniae]|nr:Ead domain protein [Klebsiella pneumoniae]STS27924.1 Ead domain protein [Klebsiella pneumoniae]STS47081.1 Ead domain protein [Klebsiella pneumoniae]HBY9758604.1 ead/Ea22-like family protein [Klebsiella pneumoniae]HBY9763549.1 ead/Ea22-like family protein [Klebsiella pneumoniae]